LMARVVLTSASCSLLKNPPETGTLYTQCTVLIQLFTAASLKHVLFHGSQLATHPARRNRYIIVH
jgi:hypothetical protein